MIASCLRLVLLVSSFIFPVAASRAADPASEASAVSRFHYILGTQAIGGVYQFTDKDPLVEAAERILAMGSTSMKFDLRPKPKQYPGITSPVELARDEPSHRFVLDMPFASFQLWVESFAGTSWDRGFSDKDKAAHYREVYDLVTYLLKIYRGTGKTFYLGHWEGDNLLRGGIGKEADARMTPVRVTGMIDWLTTRQRAVDDAKRDTPHEGVQVWHYTEINHPTISLDEGRPTMVNRVLPFVPVDFVSYSAYDATNEPEPGRIKSVLDYIESKLKSKPAITGKRVFIGEYGYPVFANGNRIRSAEEQNALSLVTIRAAMEWGCPFVLYWELYNNEVDADGSHRGFWMIDDKGVEQPVYRTHRLYFDWARRYVAGQVVKFGKAPEETEFRKAALAYFDAISKEGQLRP